MNLKLFIYINFKSISMFSLPASVRDKFHSFFKILVLNVRMLKTKVEDQNSGKSTLNWTKNGKSKSF